jgi:hypothetical protein
MKIINNHVIITFGEIEETYKHWKKDKPKKTDRMCFVVVSDNQWIGHLDSNTEEELRRIKRKRK